VTLVRYWGVVALWMAVISILSGDPFSARNTNRYIDPILRWLFPELTAHGFNIAHMIIRKTAHFTEFFVLGALCYWAARRGRSNGWRWQWTVQALAISTGWALLDEAHQSFVASRTASLADSAIDCSGAFVSQLLVRLRHCRRDNTGHAASTEN